MIDPKQLRLGNYIYNHRMWICPVTNISENTVSVIAHHYGEEPFFVKDLYPIPINKEILEKLGFKEDEHPLEKHNCTAYTYEKKGEFRIEIALYKNDTRIELNLNEEHSLYMNAKCPYLHTLQNIITDAEIDLPIKFEE